MPDQENTNNDTIDKASPIDAPHLAWHAPLAGFLYLLLLGIIASLISSDDTSRTTLLIIDLIQLLGFLGFLVFGYIKSIHCLTSKGNIRHGIAGLILNSLSAIFLALLILLSVARNTST